MGILDEDIQRVRDATDIVAVISAYTQLKRSGARWVGLCPFHTEKSGSFSVNDQQGLYYCFGCKESGDAISFVRAKEHLDFVGAVELLAGKAGIQLRFSNQAEGKDRKRKSVLQDHIDHAVDFYHQRLLTGADARAARSYLRQRGFDGDMVRRFKIGWAPDGWDHLSKKLRISDADWVDSGLGRISKRNTQYDWFRGRLLFPIFDPEGRGVGFGGRVMPNGEGPKYINSADSKVYSKSHVLYGLNWAKAEVVKQDMVIVCEGYTDVIGFHDVGLPVAVATCGTALTDEHVKLLRKFARKVVLAFDADAAGQGAAARFYEWEKSMDLDVLVAALPTGVDPGDMATSDPEGLRKAVSEALPFLAFRVNRALAAGNVATVEGRTRTADTALQIVAEHPDPLVQDQYALQIGGHCRLDEASVRERLRHVARGEKSVARPNRTIDLRPDHESPEVEALRLALHRLEDIEQLVVPELFSEELTGMAYQHVVDLRSAHAVIDAGDPAMAQLVRRLVVEESDAEPIDVASRLWDRYLDFRIQECVRSARQADFSADTFEALSQQQQWLKRAQTEVRDPREQVAAVHKLLTWASQASVQETKTEVE